MQSFKIALCQITPGRDKAANVAHAFAMIREAAGNGASCIVLPEIFYYPFELLALRRFSGDEALLLEQFTETARELQVHICSGSMVITEGSKRFNRSHLFGPKGEVLLSFDKCHLFDAQLKGMRVKESLVFAHGDHAGAVDTELGKMGVVICYDIRFPEITRHLVRCGTELLLVPAVFNNVTGPAHWECFMRTRAVENQFFVAAASQGRTTDPEAPYQAYGHSMVIDPWGTVLAEAGEEETILYADIDAEVLETTRKRLPLLQHRRDTLYTSFENE